MAQELTDNQFDTLAAITDANTGMGNRGIKADDAATTFNRGTLDQLCKRGLVEHVVNRVGRYRTPLTFMKPTPAGVAALANC